MASTHVDYTAMEWTSAVPFYGPAAVQDGKDIVQLKVLSDRRSEGGGIAWLVKFSPPPGKLIKIVATARGGGSTDVRPLRTCFTPSIAQTSSSTLCMSA